MHRVQQACSCELDQSTNSAFTPHTISSSPFDQTSACGAYLGLSKRGCLEPGAPSDQDKIVRGSESHGADCELAADILPRVRELARERSIYHTAPHRDVLELGPLRVGLGQVLRREPERTRDSDGRRESREAAAMLRTSLLPSLPLSFDVSLYLELRLTGDLFV